MPRPLNKFAIAVWTVAALYFVVKLGSLLYVDHALSDLASAQNTAMGRSLILALARTVTATRAADTIVSAALGAAQLLGLGAIIQLLDGILRKNSN